MPDIDHIDVLLPPDPSGIDHFDVEYPGETIQIDIGPPDQPLTIRPLTPDTLIQSFEIESIGPPGPQGPQGIPGPPGQGFYVMGELPIGAIDGVNKTFTTMMDFMDNSLSVSLNGLRQRQSGDYTVPDASSFQMNDPPLSGDMLIVDYIAQG